MFKLEEHYNGNLKWLPERTIFLCKGGSHAYGTNTPSSDLDVRGLAVAPIGYYLGILNSFEQAEIKGDPDVVIFDIRKFIKLVLDTNPNVIELLFIDSADWFKTTKQWEMLYEHRDSFISKRAKYTFSGYAISQLKRIRTHRSWLLNPPTKKPERKDYGLSDAMKINESEMGAYDVLIKQGEQVPENVLTILNKEKHYAGAKRNWDQYQSWKNSRNPARAELEAKYGYDSKHAVHLVRLMRMAKEILEGRGVIVKRKDDQEELLAIRNGAWSYEQLIEWAEKTEKEIEKLFESTKIANEPNYAVAEDICIKIIESMK